MQVLFDGTPAPLIYVSASQLVAVVPFSADGKATIQIQAIYHGVGSDPFTKPMASTSPGISSADSSGKGQGAIRNLDGSLNSSANGVAPGSYATFYMTGYRQTDPQGIDGAFAMGVANVKAPVSVTIAGKPAQVFYAGSTPGFVSGFAQVTIQIPSDLSFGGNLPLIVQVGDAASQPEITVAVSGLPIPAPTAPSNVTAVAATTNQILVKWTSADSNTIRFHVERGTDSSGAFIEVAVVGAASLAYTDSTVVPGTTYQYRIRAENDAGYSTYSEAASVSIPMPPAIPSNVQATAVGQTQITLTWASTDLNTTAFQIERKTGLSGLFAVLANLPNSTNSYQDTSVAASTMYVYRIRAQSASGFSAYSNEIVAPHLRHRLHRVCRQLQYPRPKFVWLGILRQQVPFASGSNGSSWRVSMQNSRNRDSQARLTMIQD